MAQSAHTRQAVLPLECPGGHGNSDERHFGVSDRREQLEMLQSRVSGKLDDLKEALDGPRTVMSDGDAWQGTRADTFGEDIGYRRTDLQRNNFV